MKWPTTTHRKSDGENHAEAAKWVTVAEAEPQKETAAMLRASKRASDPTSQIQYQ